MGVFTRVREWWSGGRQRQEIGPPLVKVDAAQTTDENRKHWANADAKSADAAYDPWTRYQLRNRSRYEAINNSYLKASVRSSADDLVGTGPRLQLTLPARADGTDNSAAAKLIERGLAKWFAATLFAIRLRIAEKSHVRCGECFGLFDTNMRLAHPVKLDVRWLEAEMCETPPDYAGDENVRDGIRFDGFGNPVEYYFLKRHPGSTRWLGSVGLNEYITVPAERVLHWFTQDRFGQTRGIPETTPALPLYSQLRRFTLATLTAAEFAAVIAGVLKSNLPLDEETPAIETWKLVELVRGALLTLPDGYEASGFEGKSTTGLGEFKREILNESGRATNQPLNVVTGNSSGYNYSSGRLDHVPYQRGKRIERNDLRLLVLDRVVLAWYVEAKMVGLIPEGVPDIGEWDWSWNWDGFSSIDENKDAQADDVRLRNGTTTYAEIFAEYGQDWEEQFEQAAREKRKAAELGLPWPMTGAAPAPKPPAGEDNGKGAPVEDTEDAVQRAMEEVGVGEETIAETMAILAPTLTRLRRPRVNGVVKKAAWGGRR